MLHGKSNKDGRSKVACGLLEIRKQIVRQHKKGIDPMAIK